MPNKNNNEDLSAHLEEDIVVEEDLSGQEAVEQSTFKGKSDQKLRKELKQVQKEAKEYLDGWQRAKADLINSKREGEKGRHAIAKFATEDLLLQLLPVLDSFDAALSHTDDVGVHQIYKQFLSVLESNDVRQDNPEEQKFDPNQHDSVETVQVENKKEDHTIVSVVQKGYTLHGKIIRPARVRVGAYGDDENPAL